MKFNGILFLLVGLSFSYQRYPYLLKIFLEAQPFINYDFNLMNWYDQ